MAGRGRGVDRAGQCGQGRSVDPAGVWTGQECGQGRAGVWIGQGRAGQGRAGQGRAGQGRAGQGRAGQGRAGQGRAGVWTGQGRMATSPAQSPGMVLGIHAYTALPHDCGAQICIYVHIYTHI